MELTSIEYSNVTPLNWFQKLVGKKNSLEKDRKIIPFKEDLDLPSNQIHTCKYTAWNFIPKNLFQQLTKPSNLYFLIIGIFQILPYTTLTEGIPVIYLPLGIIVLLSAVKDLYEDYVRSVSDKAQNNAEYTKIKNNFEDCRTKILSKDIRVGMVVKVVKDQQVPMDGLIVGSSSEVVFVSTKSLDGETNLKRKKILKNAALIRGMAEENVIDLDSRSVWQPFAINYEPPNTIMKDFKGRVEYPDNTEEVVSIDNVCLRGSQLQNTEYIYLLALYTGHDTKILLSMTTPPSKRSTIEGKLIKLIIVIFCTILVLSIIMSVLKFKTVNRNQYIKQVQSATAGGYVVSIFGWILNLTNLVPISLIVTLESVKLFQGKMITWSKDMATKEFSTVVNCSSVLEDLGTIEYIASDKTGTLTKNQLTLREIADGRCVITGENKIPIPMHLQQLLCLCHQSFVDSEGHYQSESQDEICILDFCKSKGCTLVERTDNHMKLEIRNQAHKYRILEIIQFDSDRKRQSVIYRDENNKTHIVTKGADDTVFPLFKDKQSMHTRAILRELEGFASKGFRTLLMGYKQLDNTDTDEWVQRYSNAKQENRLSEMDELAAEVEVMLEAACAIGIEDELQDEVPETIRTIIEAGIKFVIISGDKKETVRAIAKNIKISDEPLVAQENKYDPDLYRDKKLVVFARCTPKEKEQIVSAMQGRVLAIGDGANDVSMLTKATIGVGIAGKQGKAAVQAADFGIPQFKFLRRLMFYYGRQLYRKNAELVKYNFYKNFLYTFPQVTFAFFSGYSGVSIYESYMSQLFNLLFTSLPIMVYAWCDQSEEERHLLKNKNNMYALSKKEIYFGNWRIFFYLFEAVVLGFIASYLCFLLTPILYKSPNDLNLYEISSILMLYVVIYANMRVLFMQNYLNLMIFITVIIGIALYFAAFKAIMLFSTVIQRSISIIFLAKTGLVIFLCVLASLIATLLFETILNYIYRKEETRVQMTEHEPEQQNQKSAIPILLNNQ